MIKIYQAKVCLTCDEIYDYSDYCPQCLEEKFIYLRNYLPPLITLQEIKEVRKNAGNNKIQMEPEKKPVDCGFAGAAADGHPGKILGGVFSLVPSSQPSRFAPDYNPEPPKPAAGGSHYPGGKPVEPHGSVFKGRHWLDAGYARFWKALRRICERGLILSWEKH
jgi:hypothetical protein